jgi:hypothetical protein
VKHYFFLAYDDGMAGVGPTLIPDDYIRKFAQYVNDLPFALVAPLETYGHYIRHELVPPSRTEKRLTARHYHNAFSQRGQTKAVWQEAR